MKVLLLGVIPSPLRSIVEKGNCIVFETDQAISVDSLTALSVDFVVSYRYRHIIRKPVINHMKGKAINLHISLLPWNRGADPNLWSFLENTPKGVTIHYIDEGVDTGPIIAQKELLFSSGVETLATTYQKLNIEIVELFRKQWGKIMRGLAKSWEQPTGGSYHQERDRMKYAHLFAEKGWNTPTRELIGKALFK